MNKKYAFVFPGQGSQSVGMIEDIVKAFPEAMLVYEEASSCLNYDLWKLIQTGPAEVLDQTTHTQPALLATSYALWKILRERTSFSPDFLAGHSLGEFSALVCAESLSFEDGIKLVAARGKFMQEAAAPGSSALGAIIGLEDARVFEVCEKSRLDNEVLSPANFNSPGQIVIAGSKAAVERALVLAKTQGAKLAKLLPVSVASHCQLMQSAADKLSVYMESITFNTPTIPVINNVDVNAYKGAEDIRNGLTRQLTSPVQWVKTIHYFSELGVQHIVECGPNKVLTGLNKRIAPDIALSHTGDLSQFLSLLDQTLA